MEVLACKERLETEDTPGLKVTMDPQGLLVLLSSSKERSVSQDFRDQQDRLAHRDTKEQRGFKVNLGQRVPRVTMELLATTAILEPKESVVHLDSQDPEGCPAPQVPTAHLATWAPPAPPPWTTASW